MEVTMANWKDLMEDWLPGYEQEQRFTVFMSTTMGKYARLLANVEDVPFPSAFFRKLLCQYVNDYVDEETHEAILEALPRPPKE
jgi:hypothetical protein